MRPQTAETLRLIRASFLGTAGAIAAAFLVVALAWTCWPTLTELVDRWGHDPQYSHGYFVPLFSLYLLWARRGRLAGGPIQPSWWGVPFLAVGLGLRLAGAYFFFPPLTDFALVPCVAGVFVLLGGWRALDWSWPAVAFLAFMIPLPFQIQTALATPLQTMATRASTFALQTFGFAAFSEGHVIRMGTVRIGVVEACNGLSMLVLFFALATAVAMVIDRSWIERTIIVASAIPIALAANIIRITVTGVLHKTAGSEIANHVFHDLAGWLMMPLALAILWAELRVLSWVLIPAGPRDAMRAEDLAALKPTVHRRRSASGPAAASLAAARGRSRAPKGPIPGK